MKSLRFLLPLLILCLLTACGPRDAWTTYSVAAFPSKEDPVLLAYSFEYPANWAIEEGNNYIRLVSQKKLLKDAADKLKPGQIAVVLTMNVTMSPEDMVNTQVGHWQTIMRFDDLVSVDLDGRPYAYREGVNVDSNQQVFVSAVDLGRNMRVLLVAHIAEGELEMWRETLMRIVKSLRLEP